MRRQISYATLAGVLLCALHVQAAGLTRASAQQTPRNASRPTQSGQYGQFFIDKYETGEVVVDNKTKATGIVLRGPNLQLRSPRYDLKAPQVTLKTAKQAAGKNSVQIAEAVGGVRVNMRSEDPKQSAVLTSETATYTGASPGKLARIVFPNRTHIVMRDPNLEDNGPLDMVTESAYVEFVDDDTYRVQFGPGNLSGITKDPATNPAVKKRP